MFLRAEIDFGSLADFIIEHPSTATVIKVNDEAAAKTADSEASADADSKKAPEVRVVFPEVVESMIECLILRITNTTSTELRLRFRLKAWYDEILKLPNLS